MIKDSNRKAVIIRKVQHQQTEQQHHHHHNHNHHHNHQPHQPQPHRLASLHPSNYQHLQHRNQYHQNHHHHHSHHHQHHHQQQQLTFPSAPGRHAESWPCHPAPP
ncbi:hypothetical protein EGW08_018888 [Elysia chlorotica]|uniref:Uncharacterized protein n=1 Tax=Elysia chlorotica TaxID=188477 RepID=A0A3S1B2D3_ELYCH|nr:hypothetical protein EGW08_018888 [Elysia chlorotica]